MGELTAINKAASKNDSLRTTVPKSIVNQFGLNDKDKLDWSLKAEEDHLIIIVRPIKKTR